MNTTDSIAGFAYVVGTILFTVYGQLVLKWQVAKAGPVPVSLSEKIPFLFGLIFNPWVLSGLVGGFFAFVCWLGALTKFELSYAYPFMSLAFVFVLILSVALFNEPLTVAKLLGVLLIIAGIIVGSRA